MWILALGLVLAVVCLGLTGGAAAPTKNIPVKAMFVSGYLPDSPLPNIPNKILNDQGGYYQEGGGNYVHLKGGDGAFYMHVVVGSRSKRSVVLCFDSQVAPPAPPGNLPDYCGVPYFLGGTVSTIDWQFGTKNECVLSETPDSEGYYEMTIKDTNLNLLKMRDGQVAYAYVWRMWFSESGYSYFLEWEPDYLMVKASGWDGTKVTTWTITPVTAKFKHMKGETANDPVPQYYLYDNGTIPRWLCSSARRGCFHGIYNLPFELIITR